jgi:hypothetical protein
MASSDLVLRELAHALARTLPRWPNRQRGKCFLELALQKSTKATKWTFLLRDPDRWIRWAFISATVSKVTGSFPRIPNPHSPYPGRERAKSQCRHRCRPRGRVFDTFALDRALTLTRFRWFFRTAEFILLRRDGSHACRLKSAVRYGIPAEAGRGAADTLNPEAAVATTEGAEFTETAAVLRFSAVTEPVK